MDAAANPVNEIALTSAADTITGTDGSDNITAVVSALSSEKTLNAEDVIDGGAGEDTINIGLNTNFAGFTKDKGSMTNVETVNVTNNTTIARIFDAQYITGVTKYNVDATNAAITLDDVIEATNVSLKAEGTQTFTMNFTDVANTTADVVGGTADALTLTLDNVGTVEDTTTTAVERKVVTATINDIEELTIEATGENVATLGANDATSLTVVGTGSLELDSVGTGMTSVDGSAATGALTIDTTAASATSLKSVSTGSADDKVTINSGDTTANATISGGEGADKLVIQGSGSTVQYNLSGFETLELTGNTGNDTLSMKNATDVTNINVTSTFADQTTFVNMAATDLTVTVGSTAGAATDFVQVDNAAAATIDFTATQATLDKGTTNTAADAIAMDVNATKATSATINVGAYVDTTSDITAAEATSLNLNIASGKDSSATPVELTEFSGTITAAKATSVKVDATGDMDGIITAAAASTLDITAAGSLAGATFNAEKATSVTLVSSNAAAQTITLNTDKAEVVSITSTGGALTTNAASDFTAVQNLDVTTTKTFTTSEALTSAANLTFAGTATTSATSLTGTIGNGTANDYNMGITISGNKAGFSSTGTITGTNSSALTIDADAATGAVTASGAVTGFKTVTVNATGTGGNVTLGTINTANVASNAVNITASNSGTFQVGAIGGTVTTSDVTLNLDGVSGNITLAAITGDAVSVDASAALGSVTYGGTITATKSATIIGSELAANNATVSIDATSNDTTVSYTGGIMTETFTLKVANQTNDVDVTVNGGSASDTFFIDNSAGATAVTFDADSSLTLTSVETLKIDNNNNTAGDQITMLASTLSGTSIELDAVDANSKLFLTGTANADTIDLSKVTDSGTTNVVDLVIKGGAGNDTITLSATDELIEIIVWDGGLDTVKGFDVDDAAGTNEDLVTVSLGAVEALTSVTDLVNAGAVSIAATDTIALMTITGADDLDANTEEVIIANLAANISSTDALETALEVGGSLALTAGGDGAGGAGSFAAGDAFLVAYDDGTDSYLAVVSTSAAVDNTTFASGTLTATNLVKFTGISDVTDLTIADFAAILA